MREAEAADEDDNADDVFDTVDFEQFSTLTGDDEAAEAGSLQTREPLSGADVCHAACAVTCNSTVLALRQKWCLEKCVSLISPPARKNELTALYNRTESAPRSKQLPCQCLTKEREKAIRGAFCYKRLEVQGVRGFIGIGGVKRGRRRRSHGTIWDWIFRRRILINRSTLLHRN